MLIATNSIDVSIQPSKSIFHFNSVHNSIQLSKFNFKCSKVSQEVNLICFGQDSWQCGPGLNSDSIHIDFTMLRFNSDTIQHKLHVDPIQTQFITTSPKLTNKAGLNWNRFWIWIDYYISSIQLIFSLSGQVRWY